MAARIVQPRWFMVNVEVHMRRLEGVALNEDVKNYNRVRKQCALQLNAERDELHSVRRLTPL